jgi:DNA mismatch repair protein MutS
MIEELTTAGLPFARPEIRPLEERTCRIRNGYNINLAGVLLAEGCENLDESIVKNDIRFDAEARVMILTGPNRGGKTTYTQAVGLCQVLAQLGLPVPADEAALSPVDGIYTHFPIEEKIEYGTGRLGDEAKRIDEIFSSLTRHSLLLLNESLSGTSADESLYIAKDVVGILARLGVRCVFATHLHRLAAAVDEINGNPGDGDKVVSMVAAVREETKDDETKEIRRTYRIVPGPPAGLSYAREIAERYGVSYRQLEKKLGDRGLL